MPRKESSFGKNYVEINTFNYSAERNALITRDREGRGRGGGGVGKRKGKGEGLQGTTVVSAGREGISGLRLELRSSERGEGRLGACRDEKKLCPGGLGASRGLGERGDTQDTHPEVPVVTADQSPSPRGTLSNMHIVHFLQRN